jgi:hypothetical protein
MSDRVRIEHGTMTIPAVRNEPLESEAVMSPGLWLTSARASNVLLRPVRLRSDRLAACPLTTKWIYHLVNVVEHFEQANSVDERRLRRWCPGDAPAADGEEPITPPTRTMALWPGAACSTRAPRPGG